MARAKSSVTTPINVTISRPWQLAFLVTVAGSQIVFLALGMWSQMRYNQHMSPTVSAMQYAQEVYPLLYGLVGYIFVQRTVRGTVPQLFWAAFVATLGLSVYYALQMPLMYLTGVLGLYGSRPGDNWWTGASAVLTQLVVGFGVYCLALWVIARKGKRI